MTIALILLAILGLIATGAGIGIHALANRLVGNDRPEDTLDLDMPR